MVSSTYAMVPKKRKPDGIGLTNKKKEKKEGYDIPCKRRMVVIWTLFECMHVGGYTAKL